LKKLETFLKSVPPEAQKFIQLQQGVEKEVNGARVREIKLIITKIKNHHLVVTKNANTVEPLKNRGGVIV